ncbi:glycogen synthase, partial [bacterium]|nr:glycogen synthase [bacterium]
PLLAQAALLLPGRLGRPVDVIHAHDAHAALVPLCRRLWFGADVLPGPAVTALTIHNLAHQEIHAAAAAAALGLPPSALEYPGPLEFHGRANLMKGAIVTADAINTVSPTYATETVATEAFGCGLQGALAARGEAYRGILNGADYGSWNPRTDRALPAPFSPAAPGGRERCRLALRAELGLSGLNPKRPLCGFVGRLVAQKGVELLLPLLGRLADDGLGFALLGTGDAALEARLRALADARPGRIAFVRGFDEALARRIYGGCDLFLMPSLFEPCGLGQMYALRYGAPPVVRATGGLADTVIDAALPDGDGFVFTDARADALLVALRRAEALWADRPAWAALQQRGMRRRFDWARSAADYEQMYSQAGARTARPGGKDQHDPD